jgi:hypothetical protein
MWTEEKQQRLDDLRLREARGSLTAAEQTEMDALFAELDAEEAEAMRPALERMEKTQAELQQEIDRRTAEATRLERIVREHEQLLAEARSCLAQLRARRTELADEFRQITGTELTRSR